MTRDSNSDQPNDQAINNTPKEPIIQTPKPPYKPSPIRMTIIENGLTMDNVETKATGNQEE